MTVSTPKTDVARMPREAPICRKPVGGTHRLRVLVLAIVLVAAAAIAYFALNYVRDRSVERRLTGTWSNDYVREDGMVDSFVWEFLPDGTMRHHPKGQPYAETGSIDDYMWWHVSGGMLVLTFDRQFRQDASLRSRAKRAFVYAKELTTGTSSPISRQDRCIIRHGTDGSIELTLHPEENALESWMGSGTSALTRESDGINGITNR